MPKILVIYYKCSYLEGLNLSSFNNANSLEELYKMFEGCYIAVKLITLNKGINAKKQIIKKINEEFRNFKKNQE